MVESTSQNETHQTLKQKPELNGRILTSRIKIPFPTSPEDVLHKTNVSPQPADQPQQNNVSAIIHLQQLTAGYNLHIPWGQDMAPNHVTKKMIPAISGSTRFRMKLPTKSDGPALASSGISQNPTKEICLTTLHSFSTTTVTFDIVQNCRDPANFTKLMSYPSCYKSSSTFLHQFPSSLGCSNLSTHKFHALNICKHLQTCQFQQVKK